MPPRFVVSKPLHTMTNDVQREITLPKARSARCRREGGRGEVWSAGEIRARYGRDAGAARLRASLQTRSKRDPGEIHRPRCPCGAAREGRARGQPTQTAGAARVRVAGSRTATGARQRSAGAKQRGGVSLAPSEPHAPRHRGTACYSSGRRLRLPGGARRSRPCGWSRPRPRAPPRAAPTRRPSSAIRTTAVGRAEVMMSVAQRAAEVREDSGVPAPRPQCLGTRGARRSGSASSRSWA